MNLQHGIPLTPNNILGLKVLVLSSNYLVLGFIAVVLYIMWSQGFKESVMMIPIWIVLMFILFKVLNAKEQ